MSFSLKPEHIDWIDNRKIKINKEAPMLVHKFVRDCDMLRITHIVFDSDPKLLTTKDKIIIMIGGQIIYKNSFNLLTLLNPVIKTNNKYVLPVEFLDLYFVSASFHLIEAEITIDNSSFKKISFLT